MPPTLVTASAGTGKTFRLTAEIADAVSRPLGERIRLEGLVAVTFTTKAHVELASRIRRVLVERRDYDHAARMPMAYLGTVHSVCMRLLEEFAFDAALPPYLEVLPDDGGRRLREAIEASVPPEMLERLGVLARRLEILFDARTARTDWPRQAGAIMDLARANRIPSQDLASMGRRSAEGVLALLGPPVADAAPLDDAFDTALAIAIDGLAHADDDTAKTENVRRSLERIRERRMRADPRWSDWVSAGRTEPAVRSRPLVLPLHVAAAAYRGHPSLHDDLCSFTSTLFEVCARAMDGYGAWKARRRIVDFVDMIEYALRLVENHEVARELATRLDLVVVDEFQDTSPIQLALFSRLHELAKRSVWVGDAKQCIFEFAGADPELITSVSAWLFEMGGAPEQLDRNYRSRPELVHAFSTLFAAKFPDAACTAARSPREPLASLPPFGVWWLTTKNNADDADAIAEQTARLLVEDHATTVLDPRTDKTRPVLARDVGILVATNLEAKLVAAGLQRRGVPATMARDGLMATPEGTLVAAALRWLLEPGDWFSRITLEALGGWNDGSPDQWLASKLASPHDDPPAWLRPMEEVRAELGHLAPTELLDRVIDILDVASFCARWPTPQQRIGNLDALRALALRYEDRCARHREPATAAGLVRYFAESQLEVFHPDGERATDDQFTGANADAVTICTYHRAKGLEWPVVILGSLDREGRRDAFEPCPETDRAGFDPEAPLAGRWIRYWPWPFGQRARTHLTDAAAQSPEGRRVARREALERQRLLYVGFTRARDHLVLAARWTSKGGATAWLDELCDADGCPLVALPPPDQLGDHVTVRLSNREFACRMNTATAGTSVSIPWPMPRRLAHAKTPTEPSVAYRITPSQAERDESWSPGVNYIVSRLHRGPAVSVPSTVPWDALGTAVHGFLAADHDRDPMSRLATARRYIADAGVPIAPDILLDVANRCRQFVERRWPGGVWGREVPITAIVDSPSGRRRIEGVTDLLVRMSNGVILIDHKTYPAPNDALVIARATEFLDQLATYTVALEQCGERVLQVCLHFPLAGYWVDLRRV